MTQQEQDRTHELVGLLKDQCPVDGQFGDDPQCCWFHEAALALSRLLDEQARQWQPIDTAPTRRLVLVYVPRRACGQILSAANVTGSQWWVTHMGAVKPTHWMPLPPTPDKD